MDRIYFINESRVLIVFWNRPCIEVTSMSGNALELAYEILGLTTENEDTNILGVA